MRTLFAIVSHSFLFLSSAEVQDLRFRRGLPNIAIINQLELLPVTARRLLSGYGQERGRIGVEIENNLPREVELIWVETWPWWVRGFVSSLESTLNGSTSDGKCPLPAAERIPNKLISPS